MSTSICKTSASKRFHCRTLKFLFMSRIMGWAFCVWRLKSLVGVLQANVASKLLCFSPLFSDTGPRTCRSVKVGVSLSMESYRAWISPSTCRNDAEIKQTTSLRSQEMACLHLPFYLQSVVLARLNHHERTRKSLLLGLNPGQRTTHQVASLHDRLNYRKYSLTRTGSTDLEQRGPHEIAHERRDVDARLLPDVRAFERVGGE